MKHEVFEQNAKGFLTKNSIWLLKILILISRPLSFTKYAFNVSFMIAIKDRVKCAIITLSNIQKKLDDI